MTEDTRSESSPVPEQAFLTGRNLYLRGVATSDAASVNRWRNSLFPMNPDLAEEKVRAAVTSDAQSRRHTLIAFRRTDSSTVGSVVCWFGNSVWAYLSIHAWPALDNQLRQEIQAEILEIAVDFLLSEHKHYAVLVEIPQRSQLIESTALRIGMRKAYQLREALAYRGGRNDLLAYEALNPQAVARFGSPEPPVFGSVQREVRSPAPIKWPAKVGDPPEHAVIVGERLFLRPVRLEDTQSMAQWAVLERETTHDIRWPRSQILSEDWYKSMGEKEPPDWLRFSICLIESGEMIGANGLIDLDLFNRTAETESEIFRAEHRNAGLGTEAKHLLLDYAFNTLDLHMVRSYVWRPNLRSAAALRKQGYREAGVVSWREFVGEPIGDVVFDLLASEWRASRT